MITAANAIQYGRSLLGVSYDTLDCINFIRKIIRAAPGGVPSYTTAGVTSLWDSYNSAPKYKDLTWRQTGVQGARPGMLAFKYYNNGFQHVGLVTSPTTVIHSSSAEQYRRVVETRLDNGQWTHLAIHRYISADGEACVPDAGTGGDDPMEALYMATVTTQRDPLRVRSYPVAGEIIGRVPPGRTVEVLDTGFDPDWPRIRYGELVGYASNTYLRRVDDGSQTDQGDSGEGEDAPADGTSGETVSIPRDLALKLYLALAGILNVD